MFEPNIKPIFSGQSDFMLAEESVIVYFSLANLGNQDWYVLPWFTPLEGLLSTCISVIHEHTGELDYHGLCAKRAAPTHEEFVLLKAGTNLTQQIMLDKSYTFNEEGRYTVKFGGDYASFKCKAEIGSAEIYTATGTAKHVFYLRER